MRSFTSGLDIINRLRPVSFTWKEGGMHEVGLAAEEVEKVEALLTFRNNKGEARLSDRDTASRGVRSP